ncbi:MAG: pro-sigmaK processing inhibitor BofA family protein [Clostridiales bacterium]|nr:pro-sigmaK processing inhibitor BofA family protein [Clostridiales bacterium]
MIYWCIGASAAFLFVTLFFGRISAFIEWLVRSAARGAVGVFGIFAANMALSPALGVSVSANWLTGAVVGILGLPGFAGLYFAAYFL